MLAATSSIYPEHCSGTLPNEQRQRRRSASTAHALPLSTNAASRGVEPAAPFFIRDSIQPRHARYIHWLMSNISSIFEIRVVVNFSKATRGKFGMHHEYGKLRLARREIHQLEDMPQSYRYLVQLYLIPNRSNSLLECDRQTGKNSSNKFQRKCNVIA